MKPLQRVNQLYHLLRNTPSSKLHLVFLYRTISLALTSFFYLIGPQFPFIFKVGVVILLVVAAWLITDLQRIYVNNNKILKAIVLTETIILTLLLIPTGGIASPFIWYALNPILVAASFLTPLFCWGALTFYLGSATAIAYYIFQVDSMVMILGEKSYFYIVCLLTTLLASLFSKVTTELDSSKKSLIEQQEQLILANNKLSETNTKYEYTLDHIMSLYHLMENFSSAKGPKILIEEITASLLTCTQSDAAFFWLTDINHHDGHLATTRNNLVLELDLEREWSSIRKEKEPFAHKISNDLFWIKVIRTTDNIGVLGIKISGPNENNMPFLLKRTFGFLAELSEIMLERIHMDKMMDQMGIVEEQNRIANELHDNVSQRLFGIVYSLHGLKIKSRTMTTEQLNDEYQFLSESANTTIKELRSAIYRLSSLKKGEKPFLFRLKTYLDEFAKLNDIRIEHQITGDESLIPAELKKGLYRIINEACGNAVRHGECHVIDLRFSLLADKTILSIQDDGIGINAHVNEDGKYPGIGLLNIQSIVRDFDGVFSIDDISGMGTVLKIEIPSSGMLSTQEVIG